MNRPLNVLKVGAPGAGKTLSAAVDLRDSPDESAAVFDVHKHSLAEAALVHAAGDVFFERLSDIRSTLGFDFLAPAPEGGDEGLMENQRRIQEFVSMLLRRRDGESLAGTPLMEEWCLALLSLWMFSRTRKPLAWLPFGFLPGTPEFAALVADSTLREVAHKFRQLEGLGPRALRAECGSAARLVNAVFRSPAFVRRSRGGFDLGAHLQKRGARYVAERGELDPDTTRVVMGSVILLIIDHAKRRPRPHPQIRVYIDEAVNARLFGEPELRAMAETRKNALFFTVLVQHLDGLPGGAEAVLQLCRRHEWFACPSHALARAAAADVVDGLVPDGRSRAARVEELAADVLSLGPGWRWVRDPDGSRREYVPLPEDPWPDWPGLREAKLEEKLCQIYARPEYRTSAAPSTGAGATPPSSTSSAPAPRPPSSSPPSSPAERWRRGGGRPASGSAGSGGADGSA